jgi:selenocysteine lyase/cysteine desulfurase
MGNGVRNHWRKEQELSRRSFSAVAWNEMLITNSTTNGMNAIAQGLRLKAGDHILTTDQEHGGGALCWNYFAKYYGVVIDIITIPPGENNADAILSNIKKNIKNETRLHKCKSYFLIYRAQDAYCRNFFISKIEEYFMYC